MPCLNLWITSPNRSWCHLRHIRVICCCLHTSEEWKLVKATWRLAAPPPRRKDIRDRRVLPPTKRQRRRLAYLTGIFFLLVSLWNVDPRKLARYRLYSTSVLEVCFTTDVVDKCFGLHIRYGYLAVEFLWLIGRDTHCSLYLFTIFRVVISGWTIGRSQPIPVIKTYRHLRSRTSITLYCYISITTPHFLASSIQAGFFQFTIPLFALCLAPLPRLIRKCYLRIC